jgi:hypothetical protein
MSQIKIKNLQQIKSKNFKLTSKNHEIYEYSSSIIDGLCIKDISDKLGIKDIKQGLRKRRLNIFGRKEELKHRLIDFLVEESKYSTKQKRQLKYKNYVVDKNTTSTNESEKSIKNKVPLEDSAQKYAPKPSTEKVLNEISLENLMTLSHAELRHLCKELMQPHIGTKYELASRLIEALWISEIRPPNNKHKQITQLKIMTWDSLLDSMPTEHIINILSSQVGVPKERLIRIGRNKLLYRLKESLKQKVGLIPPSDLKKAIRPFLEILNKWEIDAELKIRVSDPPNNCPEKTYMLKQYLILETIQKVAFHKRKLASEKILKTDQLEVSEVTRDPDFRVGLLFGGVGNERNNSLTSARFLFNCLQTAKGEKSSSILSLENIGSIGGIDVISYYIDNDLFHSLLSRTQLYSSNSLEIDKKIQIHNLKGTNNYHGSKSSSESQKNNISNLIKTIMKNCHVVIPLLNWYGGFGIIQEALEFHEIPFLGSASTALKLAYNPVRVYDKLQELGYPILNKLFVPSEVKIQNIINIYLTQWNKKQKNRMLNSPLLLIEHSQHLTKPQISDNAITAAYNASKIVSKNTNSRISIEPLVTSERVVDISVVVIEGEEGLVALIPSEIDTQSQTDDFEEADAEIGEYYEKLTRGYSKPNLNLLKQKMRIKRIKKKLKTCSVQDYRTKHGFFFNFTSQYYSAHTNGCGKLILRSRVERLCRNSWTGFR